MRFANVILQQSDLAIVVGARLGLQQTGFNWRQFVPNGEIVHVCNDEAELHKGHPYTHEKILGDSVDFLTWLSTVVTSQFDEWLTYCTEIKRALPLSDYENSSHPGFHNPYDFVLQLSRVSRNTDRIVPCSSGGANTVMMQAFMNKTGQIFFNNRALASMGYGLAGAIGAALSEPRRRTVLVEGDGGFAQNVQDLGTAAINRLNLKIFIFENQGYASIRMTQRNYFNGAYVGCDETTGLGFPDLDKLADAYGIPSLLLPIEFLDSPDFLSLWNVDGPAMFRVRIHPEQTYLPKISSQIAEDGSMESAPLHLMTPKLSEDLAERVMRYI
jgi:acetolactate synthase-1/2/3 large subunit